MRLDHPIFRGPLLPNIRLEARDMPAEYRDWPGGSELPELVDTWKVHGGLSPDTVDFGMVAPDAGFEDSPDAEWISGGINSKAYTAMALGRHGNFFLWGFAGDPTQMTESAKRVFINTVCYMRAFDGMRPLVRRRNESRARVFSYLGYARQHADDEQARERSLRRLFPGSYIKRFGGDLVRLPACYKRNIVIV